MRNATLTRTLALAAALSSILMLLAVPAQADIGEKIILKCTHGESLSGFSQKDYNKALKELETSSEEYTDCASLIHKAQLAAAGAGKGTGAGGGPAVTAATPATPAERRELSRAPHAGSTPLRVGSQIIRPGVVHVDIASALSSLPNPLLVILAFLLACALALAGGALRNRVRNRHHN
ncbi:MAG TPA: hypothetical protein VGH56_11540 [Solirubrobacteraceae bacterium]